MWTRLTASVFSAALIAGSQPQLHLDDASIAQQMRGSINGTQQVRVLHRASVDADLDVVVALAMPKEWRLPASTVAYWVDGSTLGIFLQRRSFPGVVHKIVVRSGHASEECFATVERATASEVVLSCFSEKGRTGKNRKFLYDIRAKALLREVEYDRFSMPRIIVSGERATLLASNDKSQVALAFEPGEDLGFRLLRGPQAHQWTKRLDRDPRFDPVTFGSGRFQLTLKGDPHASQHDRQLIVVDRTSRTAKEIRLPQNTTEANEHIGPWQIVDDALWFAKIFYNAEGMTGIGGFGYFDTTTRKYQILSPQEIRRYSVSAMLVEPRSIWLGVVHRGEWGDSPGGVLRFDRETQEVKQVKVREIVTGIKRVGGTLALATDMGVAVLSGGRLRRFFIDQTTSSGRLRISEALSQNVPTGMIN